MQRTRTGTLANLASWLLAFAAFAAGAVATRADPATFPLGIDGPLGPMHLATDPLTGIFLALGGIVGLAALMGPDQAELPNRQRLALLGFLTGLAAVPLAGDPFTLILAWELMSISPGVMLLLDDGAEPRRAALTYLAYAHTGAAALLAGLLVWTQGNPATLTQLAATPAPAAAATLILLGAATKAGLMPFHAWLPEAHPAAPSHVSALMSGVMVALPSYLVLRLLIPSGVPTAAAGTLLLVGAATAALAALHALYPRDIKRILALTTVAHMGALFTLLGVALLPTTRAAGLAPYAAAAAAAYAVTHGLAKGALFLIAGAIHHATGERDLERLGGLWRTHGTLAATALIAAAGLAALPPLGGFPSEVALLSAILAPLRAGDAPTGAALLLALLLLGVAAGAGLAAVAKLTLGAFHGPNRATTAPHPTGRRALAAPLVLLAPLLVIGLLPGLVWSALIGTGGVATVPLPWGAWSPLPVAATAAIVAAAAALATRALPRPTPAPVWNCGAPPPGPRQTYTPQGLVMPFRILFAEVLRPASDLKLQEAPVAAFAPSPGRYEDHAPEFIEPWAHRPLRRAILATSESLRRMHRGPVHLHLLAALLTLLALVALLEVL